MKSKPRIRFLCEWPKGYYGTRYFAKKARAEAFVEQVRRDHGVRGKVVKYVEVLCLLLALLPFNSSASLLAPVRWVTLCWKPSPDMAVTGYWIYYGCAPRYYTNRVEVWGRLTRLAVVPHVVPGNTYYFTATAYGAGGQESAQCNEASTYVDYEIPSPPITNVPPDPVENLDVIPKEEQ